MYTYTTYDNEDYIIRDLETYSMDANYIFTKLEDEQRWKKVGWTQAHLAIYGRLTSHYIRYAVLYNGAKASLKLHVAVTFDSLDI